MMQKTLLLFLFLLFGFSNCEEIEPPTTTPFSTSLTTKPTTTTSSTTASLVMKIGNSNLAFNFGEEFYKLLDSLTNFLNHPSHYNAEGSEIPLPVRNIIFYVIIALILLLLLIAILTCCLIFILLLCWQRRRDQQLRQKDIEKNNTTVIKPAVPVPLILPPPQNGTPQKRVGQTPILNRQAEVPHSPINSPPSEVGFRPPSEMQKTEKAKRSKSEDPKLRKTVDAQKRTDASSSVSSSTSTVSSPISSKAKGKTPRQAKNGAISSKGVQTDLDSSDEEEYQERIRGNETMPGRNAPSPRTELLV